VPPNVPVGTSCIRDTYVAAAVNYAWAAEAYYRLGKYDQAAAAAVQMNENLQYARALCGGTGVGGGDCRTFSIFPC